MLVPTEQGWMMRKANVFPYINFADARQDWKNIGLPVVIAAGSVIAVILASVIIWLLLKRHDNDNNHERQHLVGDSGIDESKNSFPSSNDGRRSANLRGVSPPMSMGSSSCSDITVPKKDDFNKSKGAGVSSVPV